MRLNIEFLSFYSKRRIALAIGACLCSSAYAGPFDVVHPYFIFTEGYDANLLGFQNSAEAVELGYSPKLSASSHTETVGFSFDDQIGLQHITGDLSTSKANFDGALSFLDYTGENLQGNWNWHLGNHLYGNLGANYSSSLAPYSNFHEDVLNLRTQRNENFDLTWQFHPSLNMTAGMSAYKVGYGAVVEFPEDRSEYREFAGINYVDANGGTIGLQLAQTRGYFPFPSPSLSVQDVIVNGVPEQLVSSINITNNYTQNEVKAKVDWLFSGKTHLQFLGGWVDRTHNVLVQHNYSGFNARAIVDWQATGKTSVNFTAWREIGAVDDLTTVYSINHGVSVAPSWSPTAKTRLDLQYKYQKLDFSQTEEVAGSPGPGVVEIQHNGSLMFTYMPTLHWQIQTSAYYVRQSTSDHSSDYSGNGISCSSKYQF